MGRGNSYQNINFTKQEIKDIKKMQGKRSNKQKIILLSNDFTLHNFGLS